MPGSEPWRADGGAHGKYMYYPGGDPHNAPREAPTALNVAVLPKVNLPKVSHERNDTGVFEVKEMIVQKQMLIQPLISGAP